MTNTPDAMPNSRFTTSLEMLQRTVSEALGSPNVVLSPASKMTDFQGWDSNASIDVIVSIEEQLGVEFHYTELRHLRTAADYLRLIEAHRHSDYRL